VLSVAVLLPISGTAQVFVQPTPYPSVTAATAAWQQRGDPVYHAGALYFPTGPTVFFDGYVMSRIGTHEGVPLYEDAMRSPFTIVYVPIGGNLLRPYERLRDGDLTGTVGSLPPLFPIRRAGDELLEAGAPAVFGSVTTPGGIVFVPVVPQASRPLSAAELPVAPAAVPPAASTATGKPAVPPVLQVWLEYDGARWVSSGSAVPYAAERFVQVGERRGFPVYRAQTGSQDEIYIASVPGGPVAPYRKN
jgi:hypothetical protein